MVKATVLLCVITGKNTYESIKNSMGYHYVRIPENDPLVPGLEIKDYGTSPKDIHYHLENKQYGLVAMRILSRNGKKYALRMRSIKDAKRIIHMMSSLDGYARGYSELLNIFVSVFYSRRLHIRQYPQFNLTIDVMPIVLNPAALSSKFEHLLATFFLEKNNLRLFCEEYMGISTGYIAGKFLLHCLKNYNPGLHDPETVEFIKEQEEFYRQSEATVPKS